ncbi:MAG TPA: hypothetical protein VFP84_40935, partial [Kofleriaceae bacterium]|nr:hypothetical protein [Kofleriaceae bacterium]
VARAPRRWPAALCVTGALVVAVIAAGVTIAAQVAASAAERDASSALLADAARISSVFDAASRAAHLRADGIAATPMLRAALETDVGLRDLASSGMIGAARPGEALDVFQIRDGETAPVLHVPPRASSLPVLRGRDTLIQLAGTDVSLVASAPIAGYQANLVGGLVISTPVELAAIRRALAEHAVRASLHGIAGQPDGELVLTDEPAPRGAPPAADASADGDGDGDGTSPVTIAVASGGEWCAHGVTLEATPRRFAGLGWARPVRNMSGGLAVVLLLGFAFGFARRGRDRS